MQMGGADDVGFELGKAAFGIIGETRDQGFAHQEAQYSVAQEFQLLVVAEGYAIGRRRSLFMNVGTVSECPFQNLSIRKPVTDRDLERFQIRAHGVPATAAWLRRASVLPAWGRRLWPCPARHAHARPGRTTVSSD